MAEPGTLQISDSQRDEIRKLRGRGAAHILTGPIGSLAYDSILESQLIAFLKAMQEEMPDVFHVFGGERTEHHVYAMMPFVLAPIGEGRFTVIREGHAKVRDKLGAESGWDLSEKYPPNYTLATVFVIYRGSMRPQAPDPMLEAARLGR